MPQGDLTFFPHDVGLVLGSYLGGYLLFTAVVVPRVVALHRARVFLVGSTLGSRPERVTAGSPVWATLLAGVAPVPEVFLAWFQFGALVLGVYLAFPVPSSSVTLPRSVSSLGVPPSFGPTTQMVSNLVVLWDYHRGSLFVRPAVWALTGVTTQVLHRLVRPVRPRLLPRLLGAIHSAHGLGG